MGQKSALITVGMPVCNAMPWLREAIESLLAQSLRNFEILAIVDGGSDGSLSYLRSIRDARLRIIVQENAGVTFTLNRLLRETQTPWLARQDADDVSYPRRMERLLRAIDEHPGAGLIYSLADYHPRERCAGQFRCSRGTPQELRAVVERGYLLSICHSTVALHVKRVRAAGGYRMDIPAEDADLWWRMARTSDVQFIPEALVGFRQNPDSISSRHFEAQELAGLYVQYLLLSDLWKKLPRPLEQVAPLLQTFLEPRGLRAKKLLRAGNMHLAAGRSLRGWAALGCAAMQSPRYVLRRVQDEFRQSIVTNGVFPGLFAEKEATLWP